MKKVLIPNGSFHDIPLIKEAKKLGYYVITSGAAPDAIGHKYADEYVYGDFSDKEAMLKIAESREIDAICSNCNDFGYLSACFVAEKLGLGGHETYEHALILHHKDQFKRFAKVHNMYSPIAESFDTVAEAREWVASAIFPLIVKPTDLGAGQGICRVDTIEEATIAIKDAFERSRSNKIVIEPFIEGTSHSFNAFIVDRKVVSYYSDNEYMKYSKYRVSTSAGPADYIEEVAQILVSQTELVARELQLTDGLVHTQYILDKDRVPHILEITRRMSGDWYPYPEMKATGVDWVNYIVRAQCGLDCRDFPKDAVQSNYTGRHCLNGSRVGKVKAVHICPELETHVYDRVMWLEEGVRDMTKDYPGIIFFCFDNHQEMISILENIDNYITLEYEED